MCAKTVGTTVRPVGTMVERRPKRRIGDAVCNWRARYLPHGDGTAVSLQPITTRKRVSVNVTKLTNADSVITWADLGAFQTCWGGCLFAILKIWEVIAYIRK